MGFLLFQLAIKKLAEGNPCTFWNILKSDLARGFVLRKRHLQDSESEACVERGLKGMKKREAMLGDDVDGLGHV